MIRAKGNDYIRGDSQSGGHGYHHPNYSYISNSDISSAVNINQTNNSIITQTYAWYSIYITGIYNRFCR